MEGETIVILYHGIPVTIVELFEGKTSTMVKIYTPEGNRWSNGWVSAKDLELTEGETLDSTVR